MKLVLFVLCLLGGVTAVFVGLLVPAHLRATDPFLLRALPPVKTLVQLAADEAKDHPPAAKVLLLAAEKLDLPGTETALEVLRENRGQSGGKTVFSRLENQYAGLNRVQEIPVLRLLRSPESREQIESSLVTTQGRRVLETRGRANLTIFAPADSAAGFPLQAAVLTTAFLVDRHSFESRLQDAVVQLTATGQTSEIEEFYLNILALARRFSAAQIVAFVSHISTLPALDTLARALQDHPDSEPMIYSAVLMSRDGAAVADYLRQFRSTGLEDIEFALSLGTEPLHRLLRSGNPVFRSTIYNEFASDSRFAFIFRPLVRFAVASATGAFLLKLLLLADGAFLLALSSKFLDRERDPNYIWFNQHHLIRRSAAALVMLLLLMIVGEPYLARGGAEPPPPPRFKISLAAMVTPPAPTPEPSKFMIDPHTLLAIITFLCLQTVIYVICMVKLAEIRKQPISSEKKLKLLDNEENLFDGGLYCGLFGTAASLILLTLGAIKPSLISAYSSTLFGILFVALIKIIHVRPYKRRLILEISETEKS